MGLELECLDRHSKVIESGVEKFVRVDDRGPVKQLFPCLLVLLENIVIRVHQHPTSVHTAGQIEWIARLVQIDLDIPNTSIRLKFV